MTTKQRVLSGIRATGRLHLGNYLGAVKGMLELQNRSDLETLYMVADVHTITTPYNVKELQENRREVFLDYLAAGIDPEKSILFFQSDVPQHLELAFYFSSAVSIYRMQHLPTFKDKVRQYPHDVTMALLNYPVLMAADILIYKASLVPVGVDQEPHLEVTREIARKMNEAYGLDFPEPKSFATEAAYVPSLTGEGKMSKSVEGSFINISDSPDMIKKRLAHVPTDSGKGEHIPANGGVYNLLTLVELFQGKSRRKEYEEQYVNGGIRYGDLKAELALSISKELEPIQQKRQELESRPQYVDELINNGAGKAGEIAKKTIVEVKEHMGLSF